ncbi:MAG: nitrile hydratase subunit beta [Pseudomonadota bacterium]
MDGIHDLGGMEGFGPIKTDSPPFTYDWERRVWAIVQNTRGGLEGGTIDWWRHTIECMEPSTYLSVSYFEKWCLNQMTQFIDCGTFTLEEVVSGETTRLQDPPAPSGVNGALARLRANEVFFDGPNETPPAFSEGDVVRTLAHVAASHTRLPRYAREKTGRILAYRGAHMFPDTSAKGAHEPRHLYTVDFSACDLWGDGADPKDTVTLDLWEDYLVRP